MEFSIKISLFWYHDGVFFMWDLIATIGISIYWELKLRKEMSRDEGIDR